MKQKQKQKTEQQFAFNKRNYQIMWLGLVLIVLGYVLMIGGGSDDPAIFNEDIFNFQRLTLSPLILIVGYLLQIVAIFYKNPESKNIAKESN